MSAAVVATAVALAKARPQLSLVAEPARVQLNGPGSQAIQVTNRGPSAVVLDVQRAGFALDLRGRPKIVPAKRAAWLSVRPRRIAIAAGDAATVTIRGVVPPGSRPGDHASLLLLASRPLAKGAVAVRVRLGVVVVLRVPGRIVHRLSVVRVHARRAGRSRLLVVRIANRGNVTELPGGRVVVTLWRRHRLIARLHARLAEVLPGASADVVVRYAGRVRGPVAVGVGWKPPHPPPPRFRLRL